MKTATEMEGLREERFGGNEGERLRTRSRDKGEWRRL